MFAAMLTDVVGERVRIKLAAVDLANRLASAGQTADCHLVLSLLEMATGCAVSGDWSRPVLESAGTLVPSRGKRCGEA